MTDCELLELAAKAAGIEGRYASLDEFPDWMTAHDGEGVYYTSSQAWNPLIDDGDALRLAVRLGLDVCIDLQLENKPHTHVIGFRCDHSAETIEAIEYHGDPYAATRRAIVRAAAEIGRGME